MITLTTHEWIDVPQDVDVCRICGAPLVIEDCDEWEHGDDGYLIPSHISVDCTTQPDIDGDEWWPWFNRHWSRPYVDWLPVEQIVLEWFRVNYRYAR